MKKPFCIFLFLLLFSCNNDNKENIYLEYIDQFERLSDHQDSLLIKQYNYTIEKSNDLIRGNPHKMDYCLNKIDSIHEYSENIIKNIENIKAKIFIIHHVQEKKPKNLKNLKTSLSELNILSIKQSVQNFIYYSDSIANAELNHNIYLSESINGKLGIDKIFNPILSNRKKVNSLELYSILSMIQYRIKLVESEITNFIYYQFDSACYHFFILDVIVIPKSKVLYLGETYEAEIFLSVIDTTINPRIVIENQEIKVKQGKAYYKKRITAQDTGKVIEHGKIFTTRGYGNDTTNIPFTIEYTVIK